LLEPMKNIDWKINWQKIKFFPESTGLRIAILIAGAAEVLFLALLLALNVLPVRYIVLIILILALIDAIIIQLMNGVKYRRTKNLIALIIIALMLNVLLMGDVYVYSTYDTLKKISAWHDTWEYYNVVALKDGSYAEIDDIKGKTVYTVDMESKQLTEATERLVTKEEVEIKTVSGLLNLGQKLVDDGTDVSEKDMSELAAATEDEIAEAADKLTEEQKEEAKKKDDEEKAAEAKEEAKAAATADTHDNVILVSTSGYKLIKSNIKGFKKSTVVLDRIKVKKRGDDTSKAVDVTKDSFNVLISGLDSWGTIDKGGLSDVNMVMTINPQTRHVLLTSIPRDSYIPLHSFGEKDKLTHSGIYGNNETRQTLEDFLGIDINYTIMVNFSTMVDVIDAIGGLDIYSEYDFHSAISAHKYHKGWQHLSGRGCLYYARERKAFADGDMQRNKHQQQVLMEAIKKISSSKVLMTSYTKILNSVEDEMWTDMKDSDLKKLVRMQLRDMSKKWYIDRVNVTGGTGGAPCYSMGNENLSVVFPSDESVEEAKQAIHDTMYPEDQTVKSEEQSSTAAQDSEQ